MASEPQEAANQHPLKGMWTRSVVKRCLVAGVLVIPGLLAGTRGTTSIDSALSSAVVGCVVMAVASYPLALLASGFNVAGLASRLGQSRRYAILAVPLVFSGTGFVLAVYHGLLLSPVNLRGLMLVIIMATCSITFTSKAIAAPLTASWSNTIDDIIIIGGHGYGILFSDVQHLWMLIMGALAATCLVHARGTVARVHHDDVPFQCHGIAWPVLMAISISLMLVTSMVAPELVPMIYPALASIVCTGGAMIVFVGKGIRPVSQRTIRRLISSALVCLLLSLLTSSI
ncbi:MAG: hypothetical protein Q6373_023470 [Candidatus Sigynarchaeota archaeon]